MKKVYIVRAGDDSFVAKETFSSMNDALEYADKMVEIFGSRNVELYSETRN